LIEIGTNVTTFLLFHFLLSTFFLFPFPSFFFLLVLRDSKSLTQSFRYLSNSKPQISHPRYMTLKLNNNYANSIMAFYDLRPFYQGRPFTVAFPPSTQIIAARYNADKCVTRRENSSL